jgi:LysR family transcriptional regulator, nitrogen assimilation regulatory protein
VRQIRADYPRVSLQIREGYTTDVVDWLGAGLADIGIFFNAPSLTTLITDRVLIDQLHLVGAPGSLGRIPETEFPVRELAGLPLLLPPAPHRLRAIIEQLASEAGIKLAVEVEVGGVATLLEMVRARVGYTILPSTLLRGEVREGRLHSWPLVEPAAKPTLFSATSMHRPMNMATKVVLELATKLLKRTKA